MERTFTNTNFAERAKYGENPIPELANSLTKRGVPGCAATNLYTHLSFYREYPQIFQSLTGKLQLLGINQVMEERIFQSLTGELQPIADKEIADGSILQSPIAESQSKKTRRVTEENADDISRHSGDKMLGKLSCTHIVQLLGVDDPLKRAYYELECMRGNWSVRELKRQISRCVADAE